MSIPRAARLTHRVAPAARAARRLAVALILGTAMAGCADDASEMQAWMDQTRAETPRRTSRVPEPKRFVPFRYEPRADIDPFSNAKLQVALARFADRNKGGITPDLNRRREPLESYPLDSIRLIGHLHRASTGSVALLEAGKVVFQAKVGGYLGQNYGRILGISETEVRLKEVVQDAAGDWVERDSTLALQESKK